MFDFICDLFGSKKPKPVEKIDCTQPDPMMYYDARCEICGAIHKWEQQFYVGVSKHYSPHAFRYCEICEAQTMHLDIKMTQVPTWKEIGDKVEACRRANGEITPTLKMELNNDNPQS